MPPYKYAFKFFILLFACLPLRIWAQSMSSIYINNLQQQAAQVTIIRDTWGIPHIYGKTDADAVFGLLAGHHHRKFSGPWVANHPAG